MDLGGRLSLVWVGLLGTIESIDILTTWLGRARGAIESMPISAAVMNEGGMLLFIAVKVALVVAISLAVLVALLWVRRGRSGAGAIYAYTLTAVRVTTVALAIVCLHNAMLLTSLQ
jgi:hypothetical protein